MSGLFLEGLIFGGTYVRRGICVSKSIGLACSGREIHHFCFVLLCIRGQIPSTSLLGGLYSEGRFNRGFFASRFWGALYLEGLIFGILRYVHLFLAKLTYHNDFTKKKNKLLIWGKSELQLIFMFNLFCL